MSRSVVVLLTVTEVAERLAVVAEDGARAHL